MSAPGTITRWFWGPSDRRAIVAFRTAVGVVVVATAVGWMVDGMELLDPGALAPVTPRSGKVHLLGLHDGAWLRWCTVVPMAAAGIGLVVGKAVRAASVVAFITVYATQAANDLLRNGGDSLLLMWLLLLVVFAALTEPSHLRGHLWGARSARPDLAPVPAWPLRVVQVQMTVMYAVAGLSKVANPDWHRGRAVSIIAALDRSHRFPLPAVLADLNPLSRSLTIVVLLFEVALPVLLWTPFRRWAVLGAVGLHVAFDYALKLHLITPIMLCGLVAFLERRPAREVETTAAAPLHETSP